jgi:hypothetical protein
MKKKTLKYMKSKNREHIPTTKIVKSKKQLFKLADRTVKNIQNNIRKANKYNTGNLSRSVKWVATTNGIIFKVDAKYVDNVRYGRGRNKKMPPEQAILDWLNTPHGRSAYSSMKNRWKKITPKGASFIIRRSIKKKGIKGVDFFTPSIQGLTSSNVFNDLQKAYVSDLQKEIQKLIK